MTRTKLRLFACAAALLAAGVAAAQAVDRGGRSIQQIVATLRPGQYVWAPELSPRGSLLFVVNIETQRAVLFRNGVPIAATTVSTGRPGHDTPTGVFTILQKRKEHYSNLYNNAPMPNMQRLTWDGIALHAGKLPGYPDSHGCIRLPLQFSSLLFGATGLGMTVVITSAPAVPSGSPPPELVLTGSVAGRRPLADAPFEWHPRRSAKGMVSVIVSMADRRAIVLRDGVEIGSAPVRFDGPAHAATAYVLRASDRAGRHWLKLQFAGSGEGMEVTQAEAGRFDAPSGFRRALAGVLAPGSVIIVTPESLRAGSPGSRLTVIANDVG
jgi:hypothetical protein